jgi:hypothetical protein
MKKFDAGLACSAQKNTSVFASHKNTKFDRENQSQGLRERSPRINQTKSTPLLPGSIKRDGSRQGLNYPYPTDFFSADAKEPLTLHQHFTRVSHFDMSSHRVFTRSNSQNLKNRQSYDIIAHYERPQSVAISSPKMMNLIGAPALEGNGRNMRQSVNYG